VWVHGDWASVDEDGCWYLHGRSDDTLNIAGKRIGPAEFESAAVGHPAVSEACAVGMPDDVKGEVAWLYCVLQRGLEPSDDLRAEVRAQVAGVLGVRPVPGAVRDSAAQDPLREDRAPGRARRRAG
jgi:acetyl-CoA synthetase